MSKAERYAKALLPVLEKLLSIEKRLRPKEA